MSVDDYIKGKETRPCPVDNDAAGNMVVRGLYKIPVVAWREAVSNACDACVIQMLKWLKFIQISKVME